MSDNRPVMEVTNRVVTNEDYWHNRMYNSADKGSELLRYVELDDHILVPVFYYKTIQNAKKGDTVKETKVADKDIPCGYDYLYEVVERDKQT